MAEPTLRDIERMLHNLSRQVATTHQEVIAAKAEAAGIRIVDAKVEDLIASAQRDRDTVAALNQLFTGVRSLGQSTHDIVVGLSRRMKNLVQALTEKDLLEVGALSHETESDVAAESRLQSVDPPRG
jgi:uncharacterized protein YoxC